MKTDYKNWVPKGMVLAAITATIILLAGFIIFGIEGIGVNQLVQGILAVSFGSACLGCGLYAIWCVMAYKSFSYSGRRQLSKQVISGVADYITLPEGGKGLDIGCGSGALTIACAQRNPQGTMVGIDRWGKEYASFSQSLCEHNATAEGVVNVSFEQGNAIQLAFEDESFDAVTSNYVYHNITGVNKQKLLGETLRVLKKGGVFAIHDLMTVSRYGDMKAFVEALNKQGYEQVQLIDTTQGVFMDSKEAKLLMLSGSMLLVGRK